MKRVARVPTPVIISTFVILVLFVLGIRNNGGSGMVEYHLHSDQLTQEGDAVDPQRCFVDNPWITTSLDHFFKAAKEGAEASDRTSEESLKAMDDIRWGEYHPGQDLVELAYNETRKTYDVKITEKYPANQAHKSRCIRMIMERAIDVYGRYLADALERETIKFVVTTEDFGILFKGQNFRLPAFALSTDPDHIDIPVPDFTFGCYPETMYPNDSWHDVRELLLDTSERLAWKDRQDVIFHRSNWGVGPRKGLMPFLDTLHTQGRDVETLGMALDIGDTGFVAANQEKFVQLHEQCAYKTQIHTAGFSYSAGLKYKLACGSLVIKFRSKFEEFYEPALKDEVHVVMVDATDDGVDEGGFFNVSAPKIKKAVTQNIEKPSHIARGGQEFIRQNLTDDALDCYWYGALLRYGDMYKTYKTLPSPSPK